jgi:hypothetical protein
MSKIKDNLGLGCFFLHTIGWIIVSICWVCNLIQLFKCDFEAPFKEEVIHLIGVFIFPASVITVWF